MVILIKENALQLHSRTVPAHMGYSKYQFEYRDRLREVAGKWIEVDSTHKSYYDAVHPDGYIIEISKEFVEDVDREGTK